ncbi:hypothetical protein J2Y45_002106 [Dyadobacter sp. BE34]|uniref:Uncharacterized protein n=1 Tax=Dyadobacter fermentans TaxID=94254 RepID=A0ABU1QZ66_9BACT|nr:MULTISPECIES: hypothetical protein [Dyadobacter]MDR6805585.1 hypothetical protein [Dyadobacter fermentans]MDR7042655.1 hypothetical protein [Dyadobacter sp. BE242]MDR7196967.1 hypothetical protein [Dyadobacter sp. BE34]MDR7215598.1 hypothetical protein [Dyadobacter sp. BE31]MDR7263134.1 hypothetical protein [Dyadobacter sp. BE32]
MMTSEITESNNATAWITEAIASLYVDQTALELGVASENKKALYNRLAAGDHRKIILEAAEQVKTDQIRPLLGDYLSNLRNYSEQPFNTFAVEIGSSDISFWIEVEEYSKELERDLIIAEAKTNAKYTGMGFHLYSTIVEACDNLPVPPNFQILFSAKDV